MADVQSDLVVNGSVGHSSSPKGMVLAASASYIIPASEGPGQNDKVSMVPVPKGAVVLDVVVSATGGAASLSVDVGDDDDVDRFLDGITNTAAAVASLGADGAAAGVGHEYTVDDTVDITFLGAAPTATHVYTMVVTYMMA